MDIYKAKQAFLHYVEAFDIEDEQIRLKVVHTMHVCENSMYIAKQMKLPQEEQELAYIIGLLHDIGRFEQIRKYHTFLDAQSENHALLGVNILSQPHMLERFIDEREYDEIILCAIRNHNRFEIEQDIASHCLIQTKILRDSDKIDIYRVDCFEREEVLFLCTKEELMTQYITDEVFKDVIAHKNVLACKRQTSLDILIAHIAMIFDINYRESIQLLETQGYFMQLLQAYSFQNPITQEQYKIIQQEIQTYIQNRT